MSKRVDGLAETPGAGRMTGPMARAAGHVAHDFDLGPGRPFLIANVSRLVRPVLLPDLVGLRTRRSGVVLHARAGLLRPPPRRGYRGPLDTLTLARAQPGERMVDWAELILRQPDWLTPALAARATALLTQMRDARVGGTWWGRAPGLDLSGRIVVLAAADAGVTRAMLRAAGSGSVLVARHAARWARLCRRLGVTLLAGVFDPWPILEQAAVLHADGTDERALLAALLGGAVRCATPGPLDLTRDPVRLAAAALLLGTRYADPFTGQPIACETFLALAAEWRAMAGAPVACCVGISFWKRRRIAAMLAGARAPAFRKTARAAVAVAVRRGGGIAVWPSRAPAGLDGLAARAGVAVARVEDGFVRSKGLGADFLPPLSIVLDRLGLYYDATGPSDLEAILSGSDFPPALLARAARLRDRMVRDGVTKYNLSGDVAVAAPAGRMVVLVPGQVADDRSVLLGGGGVLPGLDVLARVRARVPEAWIIYKPHPDVEAGHRQGALPDAEVLRFADQVLRGGSMAALLARVDAVHTLTSLTGFEALLRGRPVTTYGQPFYAGWGLTTDANPPARRGRPLALDALVAGTMILYPRYHDPVSFLPCGPEIVLDRLADPGSHGVNPLVMLRRTQGRAMLRLRHWLRYATRAATRRDRDGNTMP